MPPASGTEAKQATAPTEPREKQSVNLGAALLALAALGLASPLLGLQDPIHGIIGLVILLVGIRIAWQITDGTSAYDIVGPFSNAATPST